MNFSSQNTTYIDDSGKSLPIPERMIMRTKEVPYPQIGLDGNPVGGTEDWDWKGFPIKTTMGKRLMNHWELNPEYIVLDEKGNPTGQLYEFTTGKKTVVKEVVMVMSNTSFPTLEMSRAVHQQNKQNSIEAKLDTLLSAIANGALIPAEKQAEQPKSEKPAVKIITLVLPEGTDPNDIEIQRDGDSVNIAVKGSLLKSYNAIADQDVTAEFSIDEKAINLTGVTEPVPTVKTVPLLAKRPVTEDKPLVDPLLTGQATNVKSNSPVNKVPVSEEKNFLDYLQTNPDGTESEFMEFVAWRNANTAKMLADFKNKPV